MKRSVARLAQYQHGGFGGFFHSEALPGALPRSQNSPQNPAYGLYPELISGSAFTIPRAKNRYSWLYRIRPTVQHSPAAAADFQIWKHESWVSPPFTHKFPPVQLRLRPAPLPSKEGGADFVDGTVTIAANGSPIAQDGCSANTYVATKSMSSGGRFLRNLEADTLILPQEGTLHIATEFGDLCVEPCELALIPRGVTFQVNLEELCVARGYFLENFGDHFVIPDLGPIGISSGLAHPRHFLAPVAKYQETRKSDTGLHLISKFNGDVWQSPLQYCPFDVVAWYGNLVPCKYDMRLFMAINSVTYDHPDPSINTVLSTYTSTPGLANCDFVIFPPRWVVMEGSFRPPWFHRNVMSEFMGLIKGKYDAKPDSFVQGASSIHNRFVPHGPDAKSIEKGSVEDTTQPERYSDTLAFMWETRSVWHPTEFALANLDDTEYPKCWQEVECRFDPQQKAAPDHPFPFGRR